MRVTTVKLPDLLDEEVNENLYMVCKDLFDLLPVAVRDSTSTVILHIYTIYDFLIFQDPPEFEGGVGPFRPDVELLFPTACKPSGRFVVWSPTLRYMISELNRHLPDLAEVMAAADKLRVGDSLLRFPVRRADAFRAL